MESDDKVSSVPHIIWEHKSKIAISIDIGVKDTTVAFAWLVEGKDNTIERVARWPGQEAHDMQRSIPTAVCYDANNKPVSAGSEAHSYESQEMVEENQWRLVEHFPLHLYPSDLKGQCDSLLDPLPSGLSLNRIYTDFFGYLLRHTKVYFEDRILDGRNVWQDFSPTMDVIVAHPEVWGAREHAFLRTAAVKAGLANEKEALKKILFVPDAYASLHFIVSRASLGQDMQLGDGFTICNAGESIASITTYTVKRTLPSIQYEKRCGSSYVKAGSVRVNHEAKRYLEKVLGGADLSPPDIEEYIGRGVRDFENGIRRAFRGPSNEVTIEIAGSRVNDSKLRIRRGRMKVPGSVVESFFSACVGEIISSVSSQLAEAVAPTSYIASIGSFGESAYLNERLKAQLATPTCHVVTIDDSSQSFVADGGLIWYLENSDTRERSSRSIGIQTVTPSEDAGTIYFHSTLTGVASDISYSAPQSQQNNSPNYHGINTHQCRCEHSARTPLSAHGYSIELEEEKNVNQGELRRQLRNLNRQVEDIGRAISDYLARLYSLFDLSYESLVSIPARQAIMEVFDTNPVQYRGLILNSAPIPVANLPEDDIGLAVADIAEDDDLNPSVDEVLNLIMNARTVQDVARPVAGVDELESGGDGSDEPTSPPAAVATLQRTRRVTRPRARYSGAEWVVS
ncbi:heat shock protein 70 kDa 12B [Ceratobasidium sp. AG-Ba]|nr:heat shock protein 70 kDa 12B [Ceratobasidium sp. AG-Ba]